MKESSKIIDVIVIDIDGGTFYRASKGCKLLSRWVGYPVPTSSIWTPLSSMATLVKPSTMDPNGWLNTTVVAAQSSTVRAVRGVRAVRAARHVRKVRKVRAQQQANGSNALVQVREIKIGKEKDSESNTTRSISSWLSMELYPIFISKKCMTWRCFFFSRFDPIFLLDVLLVTGSNTHHPLMKWFFLHFENGKKQSKIEQERKKTTTKKQTKREQLAPNAAINATWSVFVVTWRLS